MRNSVLLMLGLVMLLGSGVVLAEDGVLGKWQATIETQRGTNEVTIEFTGSHDALEGTWTGRRGTAELEDVAYEDGKLTFKRDVNFQGNEFTLDYSATIDGDVMNIIMSTPRGEREITANRVTE